MARLSTFDFPYRFLDGTGIVGTDTNYPIGLTIEELYKWSFRGKNFTVTSDAAASASGQDSSSSSAIADLTLAQRTSNNSAEFRDMQEAGLLVKGQSIVAIPQKNDVQSDSSAFCIVTAWFMNDDWNEIYELGGLYYPYLLFSFSVSASASNAGTGESANQIIAGDINGGVSSPDGSLSTTFLGRAISVPYNTSSSSGSGASASATISNLIVSFTEYWAHDDGTGPAYDSTTGAYLL